MWRCSKLVHKFQLTVWLELETEDGWETMAEGHPRKRMKVGRRVKATALHDCITGTWRTRSEVIWFMSAGDPTGHTEEGFSGPNHIDCDEQ